MGRLGDKVQCNPTVKLTKGVLYPFVSMEKITPGYKNITSSECEPYVGQSCSKFCKGDTIMARITPCLENGKIAQYNLDSHLAMGSTELFTFRGIENVTDNDYVFYLISTNYVRSNAINSMTGASGRQRADIEFIKKIKWEFPEYDTQCKIGKILSAYDDLIENNNKRIELLENMAQELYKEWFVRFRFPGHKTAKFENGIPEGWEVKNVKTLSKIKSGYAFKSEQWQDSGIPVIKIKDIQNLTIDTSDLSYVSEDVANQAKQFDVKPGDLLIALTGATIGKIALVPYYTRMSVNQRVGKFFLGDNPIQNVPFMFCYFLQNSVQEQIEMIAGSNAAQPNISPFDIEKLKILYRKDIVAKFNSILEPTFKEILKLQKINMNLKTQRDLLLPRLMSGKLEV